MIENMYGEGVFYDEAFELIFDEVYGPAIDENKIEVVDHPQVDIQQIGTGKNLQFTCEVFVKPDVTLGEYKGVEVKKEHTLVTEDDVNAEIEKERNKQAAEVAVDDRPVAEGDTVNLDYSGSVDGVKFAGGTAENQTLKIGSHTFSHQKLAGSGKDTILQEINKTEVLLSSVLGEGREYWLRPPYGLIDEAGKKLVKTPMVYWSVDPEDWKVLDADKVSEHVCSHVQDGDIILLHDFFPTSVEAALRIVDRLQEEGYEFVTVEELLRLNGTKAEAGKLYRNAWEERL